MRHAGLWILIALLHLAGCDTAKEKGDGDTSSDAQRADGNTNKPDIADQVANVDDGISELTSERDKATDKAVSSVKDKRQLYRRGQTEFLTAAPFNLGGDRNMTVNKSGGIPTSVADSAMPPQAPMANGAAESSNTAQDTAAIGSISKDAAPAGRDDAVVEGDIYKVIGNRLYVLNTYKGFMTIDIADPKNPKLIGKLGIFGYPIEMYIEGTTVHAVLSDALRMSVEKSGTLNFQKLRSSLFVSIDISDASAPKLIAEYPIAGNVMEGKSRRVGDIVYLVAEERWYDFWGWGWEQYDDKGATIADDQVTLYAFDVSNPTAITLADSLALVEQKDSAGYYEDYQITVTSNALLLAQNRSIQSQDEDTSAKFQSDDKEAPDAPMSTTPAGEPDYKAYPEPQCSRYRAAGMSDITVIDISDANGKLGIYTTFDIDGRIQDQFKQYYVVDDEKNEAWYFALSINNIYENFPGKEGWCESRNTTENIVLSMDVANPDEPSLASKLPIGKAEETIKASLFRDAQTAFAITSRTMDPLYAIDLSNPAELHIRGTIDGLNGHISVFRPIEGGDFLLGIGSDNSSGCGGFGENESGSRVAASLVDVRDLDNIALIDRQCVEIKGSSWSHSNVLWNYDQAHKMIGVYDGSDANIVTVPVSSWIDSGVDKKYSFGHYASLVGIMSWDLTRYLDGTREKGEAVLKNRGNIVHPMGDVKRTTITGKDDARLGINISDEYLSIMDLADLDHVSLLSSLELASNTVGAYAFGDYVVKHVVHGDYWNNYSGNQQSNEFRVVKQGADADDATPVATFFTGPIGRVVPHGQSLLFFNNTYDDTGATTSVAIYDFTDPTEPKARGKASWRGDLPYYGYGYFGGIGIMGGGYAVDDVATPQTMPSAAGTATPPEAVSESKPIAGLKAMSAAYCNGCGVSQFSSTTMVQLDQALHFLVWSYALNQGKNYNYEEKTEPYQFIVSLDISDLDRPVFRSGPKFSGDFFGLVPGEDGKTFYIHETEIAEQEDELPYYRYYIHRIDARNAEALKVGDAINVPGTVNKIFVGDGEVRFITTWYQYYRFADKKAALYGEYYSQRSLHLLRLLKDEGKAELLSSFLLKDWYVSDMTITDSGEIFVLTQMPYHLLQYYYEQGSERKNYEHLLILKVAGDSLDPHYSGDVKTQGSRILAAANDALFMNVGDSGVVVLDVTALSEPVARGFHRTMGWFESIVVGDEFAFLPAGNYGLFTIPYLEGGEIKPLSEQGLSSDFLNKIAEK